MSQAKTKRNPFTLLNSRFYGEKVSQEEALKDLMANPLKRSNVGVPKSVSAEKSNLRKKTQATHKNKPVEKKEKKSLDLTQIDFSKENAYKHISLAKMQSLVDNSFFTGIDVADVSIIYDAKVNVQGTGNDYVVWYGSYGTKCRPDPQYFFMLPANTCLTSQGKSYLYTADQCK
jgi:hypothetical protein